MGVLVVDIDSLRPDHLGCYGYEAPTTPQIDTLAEEAVRFDRAYVANSPCMPSRAGFISGRYGVHNGIVTHGPRGQLLASPHTREDLDGDREEWFTLPEVFFEHHVETAAVSAFPRHPAPWFYHVWDTFRQPREPAESLMGNAEYFQTPRAGTVADRAIESLEAIDDEDFFAYVQFWDPHVPYNRSEEEVDRFRTETPLPPYPTAEQIAAHNEWDTYYGASEIPKNVRAGSDHGVRDRDDLRELLAIYDAEIRYVDRHVGRVLEHLRATGRYDDTLIVVAADHAEEFGERGLYGCHWSVHEGTQRIPLLVKPPAGDPVAPGGRDHLVTNVDLPRTILEYADLPVPDRWQGQSLRPIIEDPAIGGREQLVLEHGLVTVQRALRTDRWKFIRTYHPGMWGPVEPDRQLYDLREDPWEQRNLAAERPERVEELEERMLAWVDEHAGPVEDPLVAVGERGGGEYLRAADRFTGIPSSTDSS